MQYGIAAVPVPASLQGLPNPPVTLPKLQPLKLQPLAAVAVSARTAEKLDDAEKRIKEANPAAKVLKVVTDIRDAGSCKRFAEATHKQFGRIDGLANSAFQWGAPGTADVTPQLQAAVTWGAKAIGLTGDASGAGIEVVAIGIPPPQSSQDRAVLSSYP